MDSSTVKFQRLRQHHVSGSITAPTVNLSYIEYADSSGREKIASKGGAELEVRDKTGNVCILSANGHVDLHMLRK